MKIKADEIADLALAGALSFRRKEFVIKFILN